jgi:hypothetical protein
LGQGEYAAALEAARALHARAGDNPALARDEMAPPRTAPLCTRPAHRRGALLALQGEWLQDLRSPRAEQAMHLVESALELQTYLRECRGAE